MDREDIADAAATVYFVTAMVFCSFGLVATAVVLAAAVVRR